MSSGGDFSCPLPRNLSLFFLGFRGFSSSIGGATACSSGGDFSWPLSTLPWSSAVGCRDDFFFDFFFLALRLAAIFSSRSAIVAVALVGAIGGSSCGAGGAPAMDIQRRRPWLKVMPIVCDVRMRR